MKKITLLLVILLITAVGFGQNLVLNESFEESGTGELGDRLAEWEEYGDIRQASWTDRARTGIYFAIVKEDNKHIYQILTVTPGATYQVDGWYQYQLATDPVDIHPDDRCETLVSYDDGTGTDVVLTMEVMPIHSDQTWEPIPTQTFLVPAGVTSVKLRIGHDANRVGTVNNSTMLEDIIVELSSSSGIEDLAKFDFGYYPNPAKDNLYLSAAKNIDNIAVYSLLGQEMLNLAKPGNSINVANLAKGVYIMEATIEGNTGSFKFIKE